MLRKSARSFTIASRLMVTSPRIPLQGYKQASRKDRIKTLKGVAFLRTWCKDKGKGEATINVPPTHLKGKEGYLWKWRLPVGEANQLLLVRNVILDKEGCLCKASRTLATALKYPHHIEVPSSRGRWRRGIYIVATWTSRVLCFSPSFSFTYLRSPSN